MLIYIIVGSVRESRTAIKVANWVQQAISELTLNNLQTEIVDLRRTTKRYYISVIWQRVLLILSLQTH